MNKFGNKELEILANSIRILSVDAINNARGGHVGTPLGSADIMATLFANFLSFNPETPTWCNRDRFVLSAGHACAMLYSTLHLLNYKKFDMGALKTLRRLNSIASGHPERNIEAGIEVTTGPLGEGVSMAVGLAVSEKMLSAKYPDIISHLTYAFVGDGCLMEGVSYEALSLAGNLGLNNLIVIYDRNNITIDGELDMSSSEDVKKRMESFGFNVLEIDGHNFEEINLGLTKAKELANTSNKPTFIICNTIIGYGIPSKERTAAAHGFALKAEDIATLRKNLNWDHAPFEIPVEVQNICESIVQSKKSSYNTWEEGFNKSSNKESFSAFINLKMDKVYENPEIKKELESLGKSAIDSKLSMATRVASGKILEVLTKHVPNFIGGSADLSSSNNTINKNSVVVNKNNSDGNYIHYGIREHAMGAIMNGITCYGNGFLPYGGTFLVFSDFMRPAIRLAALMEVPLIYIFTHDNISLGGDGPTHQPIEHIDSLRLIPNLDVIRPCDMIETIEAYELALNNTETPTALILGRGDVPTLRSSLSLGENKVARGGYIIKDNKNAEFNIISSGSELYLVMEAEKILFKKGIFIRVISMPALNRFAEQDYSYKDEVLGDVDRLNIVVEAKKITGYAEVLDRNTSYYGLVEFGESGESNEVLEYLGYTVNDIVQFVEMEYEDKKDK